MGINDYYIKKKTLKEMQKKFLWRQIPEYAEFKGKPNGKSGNWARLFREKY